MRSMCVGAVRNATMRIASPHRGQANVEVVAVGGALTDLRVAVDHSPWATGTRTRIYVRAQAVDNGYYVDTPSNPPLEIAGAAVSEEVVDLCALHIHSFDQLPVVIHERSPAAQRQNVRQMLGSQC